MIYHRSKQTWEQGFLLFYFLLASSVEGRAVIAQGAPHGYAGLNVSDGKRSHSEL
jgi:hypothetical protein